VNRTVFAHHFHSLTAITREEIFGSAESAVQPINLPADSATMFAGYVGKNYEHGRGLMLLAINPGGGGDAYVKRIAEDEVFYPLLQSFKAAQVDDLVAAFERINQSFASIVQAWNLWRILGPTLDAAGRTIDDVAYMNVVPYRTRQDKMPPASARRLAWSRITAPTIQLLAPLALITLGKKAESVVSRLVLGDIPRYCVPRTIGDTYVSEDARAVHARIQRELGNG
jgi:hypothetical protein